MENFLKILWKTETGCSHFTQPVESDFLEKVEILSAHLQSNGFFAETFQPNFQHAVEKSVESC